MSEVVLRDYQRQCVKAIKETLDEPLFRGVVKMPCGTGKTVIIRYLISISNAETHLIIVPSLSLVSQTYNEMNKINNCKVKSICSSNTSYNLSGVNAISDFMDKDGKKVIIVTYGSIDKIAEYLDYMGNAVCFDNTYVDEAHHLPTCDSVNWILNVDSYDIFKHMLFFTATPTSEMNENWTVGLECDTNGNLVVGEDSLPLYGQFVYNYSLGQAIYDGHICKYRIVIMFYMDKTEETGFTKNKLSNICEQVKFYCNANNIKKLVTYHRNVQPSKKNPGISSDSETFHEVTKEIMGDTYTCLSIKGSDSNPVRDLAMETFRTKERAVITSCRTISEGTDIPCIDAVLIMDPKFSPVDIIQTVGRGMRNYPGKEVCDIIIPVCANNLKYDTSDIPILDNDYATVLNVVKSLRSEDTFFDSVFTVTQDTETKGEDEGEEYTINDFVIIAKNGIVPGDRINIDKLMVKLRNSTSQKKQVRNKLEVNLGLVKEFYEKHGRFPLERAQDPKEKILGTFMRNLKRNKRVGIKNMKDESNIKLVEQYLPNIKWDKDTELQIHSVNCDVLLQFIEEQKSLPVRTGNRPGERKAVIIRDEFRRRYNGSRGAPLPKEIIARMNACPLWKWKETNKYQVRADHIAEVVKAMESGITLPKMEGTLKTFVNNSKKDTIDSKMLMFKECLMCLPGFVHRDFRNDTPLNEKTLAIAAFKIKTLIEKNGYVFDYTPQIAVTEKHLAGWEYTNVDQDVEDIKELLAQPIPITKFISETTDTAKLRFQTVRGSNQSVFRHNTMIECKGACIVSKIDINEILQACHIKPYSEFKEPVKSYVDNGIILRSDLHILFDKFMFTILPTGYIMYVPKLQGSYQSTFRAQVDYTFNDQQKKYIRWHNKKFLEANPIHINTTPN